MNIPTNAQYLSKVRKNQIALLTTKTTVKLSKSFLNSIGLTKVEKIHTRYVQLNCDYAQRCAERGIVPANKPDNNEWVYMNVLYYLPPEAEGEQTRWYLRFYPYADNTLNEVSYCLDNVEVGKEDPSVQQILAEISRSAKRPVCQSVKWENILELSLMDKQGLEPETDVI